MHGKDVLVYIFHTTVDIPLDLLWWVLFISFKVQFNNSNSYIIVHQSVSHYLTAAVVAISGLHVPSPSSPFLSSLLFSTHCPNCLQISCFCGMLRLAAKP